MQINSRYLANICICVSLGNKNRSSGPCFRALGLELMPGSYNTARFYGLLLSDLCDFHRGLALLACKQSHQLN